MGLQNWFPEAFEKWNVLSVHELLEKYIKEERIKINKDKFAEQSATVHDPCNYGRKSEFSFGQGFFEEPRWITQQVVGEFREMNPNRMNNFCCGAGGGAWAMPYSKERIYYGRVKAQQIKETGADMVVAPCHNCRDQIMKSLNKEYELGVETIYLWELVAEALEIEPWSEEEIARATAERDAQWERDDISLEEEEWE